jgi:hypothetical protein
MRSRTPSRAKISSCQLLGQIVFDRTPIAIPCARSADQSGSTSGAVQVDGSQNAR